MDNHPKKSNNKLNIFQKIRIKFFLRNMSKEDFDFRRYINAPAYIKRNVDIIEKLRRVLTDNRPNMDFSAKENIFLAIPQDIILDILDSDSYSNFLNNFSIENQINFSRKKPSIVKLNNKIVELMNKAIELKQYDFIALYPDLQDEVVNKMPKEVLDLELPNMIKYLKESDKYIAEQPYLLKFLDVNEQFKYVYRDRTYLQYVSEKEQLEFIKKYNEYAPFASTKVAEEFANLDEKNLAKTSPTFQYKTIQNSPEKYDMISEETKDKIWNTPESANSIKAILKLLEYDSSFSKKIIENKYNLLNNNSYDDINYEKGSILEHELIHYFENCTLTQTIDLFEKSKLLSSHSTLLDSSYTLHGSTGGEILIPGREGYCAFQKRILRNLKDEQIKGLIDLDVNYVLPYLGTENNRSTNVMWELTDEGKKVSQNKCRNLLRELYGEELSNKLEECVKKIYSLNMKEQIDADFKYGRETMQARLKAEKNYTSYFKILFNKNIIQKNSIKDINAYFSQINLYEDPTEEFYRLIENAYGDSAVKILKSRPGLNVHTINSFEDFDNRILSNFGDSFVHNLLNYNIRDHQELMGIIKDENKLECFKIYYELLSEVFGYNAETMQRAISEYNYFDKLLQNIKDIELTEKQYSNLITVLCSKDNQFNINTLEELDNYEDISYSIIRQRLENANGNLEKIKKIISGDILGFRTESSSIRDYGYMLTEITELYDISMEKERNSKIYTDDEKRMLECLEFIQKEKNPKVLLELALDLINQKAVQNPIIMYNAVKKITEHQTELFNSSLLTIEKMDKLCEEEHGKKNPKIIKEVLDNGLTRYILKGIDFKFMPHNSGGMTLKDLVEYEGHLGCNNICTRLISQNSILKQDIKYDFIYTSVKEPGGIQAFEISDAKTEHIARRIHGLGGHKTKINYDIIENGLNHGHRNEVAQNRNLKRNANINNKNMGGKILPDAFWGYDSNCLSQEDIDIMKKYNIPIIYIDREAYIEIAKNRENNKEENNSSER